MSSPSQRSESRDLHFRPLGDNYVNVPYPPKLRELVSDLAVEAGFDLAGVAPVSPPDGSDFPELAYFREWIARGYAGEMRYLEARNDAGELKRASAAIVAPWARSVIVCALNYNTFPVPRSPSSERSVDREGGRRKTENGERRTGCISRYAWSQRDYHDVFMDRLRRLEAGLHAAVGEDVQTRCYVDTGPLVERVFARYAGIGWVGKNTCIINQRLGSWLFLGVILTSLEAAEPGFPFPTSAKTGQMWGTTPPDRCGTCTRCLDACPTAAFTAPRQLDATRCISYLTIEKRGAIDEELRTGIGNNVFGCDICQDVCPWNRKAPVTTVEEFQPRPGLVNPSLVWLATISEEDFRQTFRGSPIKRARRTGLRRNAIVAMGNSGDTGFLPLLRQLADDPDENVAIHARWAIQQIMRTGT